MHIILYVLDALRVDHLSTYGYQRQTSPHIDALARGGVVFENCFTSSTWTRPVAASILTGTYPRVHLTRSRYDMFSTNLTRLPEALRAGGFKTAAFSTMGNIASEIGFSRGFDRYVDLFRDPAVLSKRRRLDAAEEGLMHAPEQEIALPRAEDVHGHLFPWLEEHREAKTFSFIWSIETHVPYQAPDEFRHFSTPTAGHSNAGERDDIRSAGLRDRQRLMDLYDEVIYYNDHCIGQIVDHLKRLGIYEDTCFIVASDHGDAFYEHGFYAHGQAPFEELIHVPLIIRLPGGRYAGRRVAGLVELIDIFPTVMAVAGLSPGTAGSYLLQGQDVLPLVDGSSHQVREHVFSDTQSLDVGYRYLSVRSQRWKYIQRQRPPGDSRTFLGILRHVLERRLVFTVLRHPRHFLRRYLDNVNEHLFDLEVDLGEQHNLAATQPERLRHLQSVLDRWQQKNDELAEEAGSLAYTYEEDETLRQHLEKLGYL